MLPLINNAQAKTNVDADKLNVSLQIDMLKENDEMLPKDMIEELDVLISLSQKNNWLENTLKSKTLKAELLIFLEKLPEARKIIQTHHPIVKLHNFKTLDMRMQLIALSLSNVNGLTPEIEKKIMELEQSAEAWSDKAEAGSIFNAIGHSLYVHGKLDRALINLQKAYNIFVDLNDSANLSDTLNSIANLYQEIGDLDKAINYLQRAVDTKRRLNDSLSISIILYNLGDAYIKNSQNELAIEALTESLQISLTIEDEVGIAWTKQSLADLRLKQNKPEQALVFYLDTEESFSRTGDNRKLMHTFLGTFDCHILLKNFSEANIALKKVQSIQELLLGSKYQADIAKRQATLSHATGNYQEAYSFLLSFINYIDETNKQEKEQGIQKLKIGFETELKNNQNKILQKENELQQLKISQQNNERILWMLWIFLAITIIFFICFLLFKQIKSRNKFQTMALSDHLTNSPNRRAILQKAEDLLQQAKNEKLSLYIGLVDLDFFKKVNDTYGHDVGDEVLKTFALSCQSILRKQDSFGRFGGEEWLFVFTEIDEISITNIFERLKKHVNNSIIKGYPEKKLLKFSVGSTKYNFTEKPSLEELIALADKNLYEAKENGRNQITFDESSHYFS
jgi:diguanylate cyclase (GGDEF)-like protein